MFTVLFAYVASFISCCLVRDLCSISRRFCVLSNPPLPPSLARGCFSVPVWNLLSWTKVTVIWNQKPKAGLGAVPQFKLCYWSPWENFPGEHHVKLWDGTKLISYSRFIWLSGSITLIRADTKRLLKIKSTRQELSLTIKKSNFVNFRPYQKTQLWHDPQINFFWQWKLNILDCYLTNIYHIHYVADKISKAIGLIARLRHIVSTCTLLNFYQTLIASYLI